MSTNKKPEPPKMRNIREGKMEPEKIKKRDHFKCEMVILLAIIILAFVLDMSEKLSVEFAGLCAGAFSFFKKKNSDNLKEKLCNNRQQKGET